MIPSFNSNNFFKNIKSTPINQVHQKQLIESFFSISKYKRYVIGKNAESLFLINNYKIDGIIDDFSQKNKFWHNVPILKSKNLQEDCIIINCSTSIWPNTVKKNLLDCGLKQILHYYELLNNDNYLFPEPLFVKEMKVSINKSPGEWNILYESLVDDKSKQILTDIVRYRLTANPQFMQKYKVRLDKQYFESFMNYSNEIFVDAGGFNGDTSIEFCNRYPDYKRILFFEPSKKNMRAAQKNLKHLNNIVYYQSGLSDKDEVLSFNTLDGSSSKISKSGKDTIKVAPLDTLITDPVTFIKMDLEGWEMAALKGCQNHIINDKPKLAIAVYHSTKDFLEIPNYVLSLNPQYQLFMRHYTEGWSETVLYFVPRSKNRAL